MQGRKAGIKSKYPEPFRRDIPFKWQPVRRLVFTVAVRKVHKKKKHLYKENTQNSKYFLIY